MKHPVLPPLAHWFRRIMAASLLIASSNVAAIDIYGAGATGVLIRFDSATPGTLTMLVLISGLGPGESVVGMDFRPANGRLYAVTRDSGGQGRLYTVAKDTGAAALVAPLVADPADSTSPFVSLNGTQFGVDFNPMADRLRMAGNTGVNIRVNPNNGFVTTDADLNPATAHVVGAAYANSFPGSSSTSLYDLDSGSGSLLQQNPPNNGTLIVIGALGVATSDAVGFDIESIAGSNTAYATLTVAGTVALYGINLVTGAANKIGNVGGNPALISIAILSDVIFRNGFD